MPLHAETLAHLFYSGRREGGVVNDPNPPILLRGNGARVPLCRCCPLLGRSSNRRVGNRSRLRRVLPCCASINRSPSSTRCALAVDTKFLPRSRNWSVPFLCLSPCCVLPSREKETSKKRRVLIRFRVVSSVRVSRIIFAYHRTSLRSFLPSWRRS